MRAFWTDSSSNDLVRERIFERDYDYIKENPPVLSVIDENYIKIESLLKKLTKPKKIEKPRKEQKN